MINKNIDIESLRKDFLEKEPNHIVIDGLFDEEFIKSCEEEFLNMNINHFMRYSNKYFEFEKYAMNDAEKMPKNLSALFNFIHSDEFISIVSKITNFEDLYIDDKRWGGGLHQTKKSGYLSVHKDFNVLPESYRDDDQMLRCINLIGYITDEDTTEACGDLEFWDDESKCIHKINNKFNRWVLFDTRDNYHGHPYPYSGEKPRMSIASYYYIKTKIDSDVWRSTQYLKLPWMEETQDYIDSREERANSKKRYKDFL